MVTGTVIGACNGLTFALIGNLSPSNDVHGPWEGLVTHVAV